ncbi:MAG: recombinase RecT [Lachnospiraceae bacterium]|nr:recombinase RecT [Lachnospiraceae bacterium]MBR4414413.1 recombinase RecT [Aeriscardovia sp.]
MANEVQVQPKQGIASFLTSDKAKENIINVVGERDAQRFISSVVSAVQTNPQLAECTNQSILSAALLGQSLNLPQSPQIGMFYFVPYEDKKKGIKEAQFQISYKGMLQLAMRSGQYKKIHVTPIKEGELVAYNPIEDEYTFKAETDFAKREALPTIGYYCFFEMNNGLRKELYWSKEQMEAHAKRYSASYRNGWSSSIWKSDFDKMAMKTMLRQLIGRYGTMSVEMQTAYTSDQAVLDENVVPQYVDNVEDEPEKAVDVMADVIDSTATEVPNE